jgi:hypothetical protein
MYARWPRTVATSAVCTCVYAVQCSARGTGSMCVHSSVHAIALPKIH